MESAKKLNPKQLKFSNEYLKGVSATQAAITAGYSKKTAKNIATRLLTFVHIQAYIEARKEKAVEKSEITIERIQQEYARIAFFDIRRIYNPDGTLIPIKDLDDDTAAAISSIESIQELYRGKTTGTTKKVKGFDKIRALDGLGKIFGAFKADNEQSAPVVNVLDVSHLTVEQLKELKYGKSNG